MTGEREGMCCVKTVVEMSLYHLSHLGLHCKREVLQILGDPPLKRRKLLTVAPGNIKKWHLLALLHTGSVNTP